ncbi:hypothetical protein HELRODRAFT_194516 [Helobdella robusta]|uniref:Peptidase M12B domain-containing protein n=1 Tax=Helobdella robusta TaxID=6412 RepID=T1FW53_HELRO|nr:hypothetical protein HELRODRAFT_194516 [Helobdella robusta]ESN91184.1 hypothetical protein HELRODRAFT_194516 [Helobdella robusta]
MFKIFGGIFVFTLLGSFARTADDVVISFPRNLELSLPIKKNVLFTVHLSREKADAVDADVLEDANGTQWHMTKLELVRNYGNVEDSAAFIVSKVIKNGVLKTKYVGDFVHDKESYSVFPNTLEQKTNKKETLEEHSVVLEGEEYVVALMKPLPAGINDVELKPPANTVYLNGQKISESGAPGEINRVKRDNHGVTYLEVETLFVVDYSVYKKWMQFNRNNKDETIQMLRHYFAHIAYGVTRGDIHQKYQSIDTTQYRYSVKLVGYYICETPSAASFVEESRLDATRFNIHDALSKFARWNYDRMLSKTLPKYDLAVTFTCYDSGSVLGLAYVGTSCTTSGVGVVRNAGHQDTVLTAAHEMGHILGASHDEERNPCPGRDLYIMSAQYDLYHKNNHHTFSSCSRDFFQNYAYKLDSNRQNCMLSSDTGSKREDLTEHVRILPGTKYSLNVQCQMVFDLSVTSCIPEGPSNCGNLFCSDPNRGGSCMDSARKVLPGTPCGNKMWCLNGKCVSNSIKPDPIDSQATTRRPNANPPSQPPKSTCTQDVHVQWCSTALKDEASRKAYCQNYMLECCKTCAPYVSGPNGNTNQPSQPPKSSCTQDLQAQWCSTALYDEYTKKTYCTDYKEVCCKTCAPYIRG